MNAEGPHLLSRLVGLLGLPSGPRERGRSTLTLVAPWGSPLVVLPGLPDPGRSLASMLLRRALVAGAVPPGGAVLDLPCGVGGVTVEAARLARRVAAVDSDPEAVRCTRINALLNHCDERVVVRLGTLFDAVAGNRFDVVLCDATALAEERDGTAAGRDLASRLASGLRDVLATGGVGFVTVLQSRQEGAVTAALEHAALRAEVIVRRRDRGAAVSLVRCARRSSV